MRNLFHSVVLVSVLCASGGPASAMAEDAAPRNGDGLIAAPSFQPSPPAAPRTSGPVDVLSLDETRTGDALVGGGDRYLTGPAMAEATQMLLDAGFSVGITDRFTAGNIAGTRALFTGLVDVDFTPDELDDIENFVRAGGGLVMMRDWGNYYPACDPLATRFGVTYDTRSHGPAGRPSPVVKTLDHPIWDGPAGSTTSFDEIFSSAVDGATGIGDHSTNPGRPGIAVKEFGAGRIVCLTDAAGFDLGVPVPQPGNGNGIVWENIFHWVAGGIECDAIRKFTNVCKAGRMTSKIKSRLAEGTILTVSNNGDTSRGVVNSKGKAKVKVRGQGNEPHEMSIVECPDFACTVADCNGAKCKG